MPDRKLRVAIVGGGCAAMTTAFELTRPEQQGRFDVTVYQQGWRLGGKGASGRGPNGRIEEHGLHIWMGFYENAFRMMRAAYGEIARDPAKCPIADWKQAFFPSSHIGLASFDDKAAWSIWATVFPPLPGEPGEPLEDNDSNPFALSGYLTRAAAMMRALFEMAYRGSTPLPPDADGKMALSDLLMNAQTLSRVAMGALETVLGLVENQLLTLSRLLRFDIVAAQAPVVAELGRALLNGLNLLRPTVPSDPIRHHAGEVLEAILAALVGMFRAGTFFDPRGYDALDEHDFIDWLRANGLSDRGAKAPFLLGLYSLMFAYEDGDPERPRVAAGQALRGIIRMFFTYRGSLFWKMTAGMGDVIFGPLYEVLKKRGAKFEFFHRLKNVKLGHGPSGAYASALEFDVQAEVKNGEYRPLVDVHGLPSWPADPNWDQLVNGPALREAGVHFESHWDDRAVRPKTIAVGDDFDFVVIGVGGAALPYVCGELLDHAPRWRAMAAHMPSVATQALQLWTRTPMSGVGWNRAPITMTAFTPPFDTWSDMTHLVGAERWGNTAIGAIGYFCNVIDERDVRSCWPADAGFQGRINAHVRKVSHDFFVKDLPHLWPDLSWDVLVNWRGSGDLLDSQFYCGNVNPTDRYVQSLPGTTKYRISPLDRTFDNLTIAGDWTSCGMSFGCVESAVMSGLLASHALSGFPKLTSIIGYDHP